MLITLSRQYGAGGSEIARRVAASLDWSVVDNEIVDQVAQRAGLSRAQVARHDERVPSFVERLARTLAVSSQEFVLPEVGVAAEVEEPNLVRLTEAVVREAAAHGRVVLVGRAAPVLLGREATALHVKIVAPKPFRVRTASARLELDQSAAEKMVDEMDSQRARYHKEYYGRDWHDPTLYHLVLNSEALGFEGAAEVILARARAMGWGPRSEHPG